MLIDFSEIEKMTIPGMNGGTGSMTARMDRVEPDKLRMIAAMEIIGG